MARPCGCAGECGCTVVGIDGIRTSGAGTVRDPILVGLNNPLGGNGCEAVLDCVGGAFANGLSYNDTLGLMSTRLSADADNNIIYGTDGGLYSTGGGEGGGDGGGVTVASLPATKLVGGYYGAGYANLPEGTKWAYEAAMNIEDIHFIHVPVRRLGEYVPAAVASRIPSDYTLTNFGKTILDFDTQMYKRIVVKPSGSIFPDSTYDSLAGYFGAAHPDTGIQGGHGGLLLSDVFRIASRRKVLVLESKDVGYTVGDSPVPFNTFQCMDNLVRQWGMTKGVIAGSQIPNAVDTAERNSIIEGMRRFKDAGAATAMFFYDTGQLAAYPPATLANLYGDGTGPAWVFMNYELVEANTANATAYRDAGFQVVLMGAHRQYSYEMMRTLNLRGLDSPDPVYVAGFNSYFRYRRPDADWQWPTPDYGRHAYRTQQPAVPTWERGYTNSGLLHINETLVNPVTSSDWQRSGYLVLMGEQCPIPDPTWSPSTPGFYGAPTNYDIEVGFSWSRLMGDRTRWMGVFFGVPEDRPLSEWVYSNTYTKGYQFQLSQNGTFTLQRYDGIPYTGSLDPSGPPWPYQFSSSWASTWGTINPLQEYRVLIQVRPGTVTMGRLGPGNTVLNGRTFDNTDIGGRGERWRGPYFYVGRHFWQQSDGAVCRFHNVKTRVYT